MPQASVAVKVTVALPVSPQSSLRPVKSLLHSTAPQISVAIAPPLLPSQFSILIVLPTPSHSTTKSEDSKFKVGDVVSIMIKLAVVWEVLPHSSVAVKTARMVPVDPQAPSKSPTSFTI